MPFFLGPLQTTAVSGDSNKKETDITAKLSSTYCKTCSIIDSLDNYSEIISRYYHYNECTDKNKIIYSESY